MSEILPISYSERYTIEQILSGRIGFDSLEEAELTGEFLLSFLMVWNYAYNDTWEDYQVRYESSFLPNVDNDAEYPTAFIMSLIDDWEEKASDYLKERDFILSVAAIAGDLFWENISQLKSNQPLLFELAKFLTYPPQTIPEYILSNVNLLIDLVSIKPSLLEKQSVRKVLAQPEFVKKCLHKNGLCLRYFATYFDLSAHPKLFTIAVNNQPLALEFVPIDWQKDHVAEVFEAVKKNGSVYNFVSSDLETYKPELLELAVQTDPAVVMGKKNNELIRFAIESKNFGRAIFSASGELLKDKTLLLKAMETEPRAFGYTRDDLRTNLDFCLAAYQRNPEVLEQFSQEMQAAVQSKIGLIIPKAQGPIVTRYDTDWLEEIMTQVDIYAIRRNDSDETSSEEPFPYGAYLNFFLWRWGIWNDFNAAIKGMYTHEEFEARFNFMQIRLFDFFPGRGGTEYGNSEINKKECSVLANYLHKKINEIEDNIEYLKPQQFKTEKNIFNKAQNVELKYCVVVDWSYLKERLIAFAEYLEECAKDEAVRCVRFY